MLVLHYLLNRDRRHYTPRMNSVSLAIILATAAVTVTSPSGMLARQASTNSEAAEFQTEPRRAVVRPGESVTLLGNAGTPLVKCHFYMPGGRFLDFSDGPESRSTGQYEYFGRGLDSGECGIRIKMADDEDDGVLECKVKPLASSQWERSVAALRVTNVPVSDLPVFDIEPRSSTLVRGDDITITCNTDREINMCHFYLPGPRLLNLDRGEHSASTDEYRYHGTTLRDGQCGVTLTGVDPSLTGYVVCKVGDQVTGAWETDVLKITTTNEESTRSPRATRTPAHIQESRTTTPSNSVHHVDYSHTSSSRETSESTVFHSTLVRLPKEKPLSVPLDSNEEDGRYSEATRRPLQSHRNKPTTPSPDENYSRKPPWGTQRPSQSVASRQTTPSTDDIFTRFPSSGSTRRPTQSYGNRPTTSTSGEIITRGSQSTQPHENRPTNRPTNRPSSGGGNSDGDEECGLVRLAPAALVTRGQGTERGQWPWHVAMYQNKGKDLAYICGGSLISRRAVVTAAHCVTRRPSERVVNPETLVLYFGKYRRLVWTEEGIQSKQIDKIHVHPTYNGTNLRGDIAVIVLKSPVDYTDYVRHVCLWDRTKTELSQVVGKAGTVVGWGRDESGDSPPELMMAKMPVVDHQTCIWSYQQFFSEFTSNKTLCAGFRNGTSACNGDSGGGLVFPTKKRGVNASEWHLRALVSLSVPKGATRVCDPNHYVVFTDVAKYLSWISSYMR